MFFDKHYMTKVSVLMFPTVPLPQGFYSRPRAAPRALHISPSSSAGTPSHGHTHYHAQTLPVSQRQPNGRLSSDSSPGSAIYNDSRRRLQPIGSDSTPKLTDHTAARVNGYIKRNSLILESTGSVFRGGMKPASSRENIQTSASREASKDGSDSAHQKPSFLPPIV